MSSKMKNSNSGPDVARVADAGALQVVDRLAGDVAGIAAVVLAGDRGPGCCRSSTAWGSRRTGRSMAVSGCGTTSMSLSLIACQPRMLEPSKPRPSSNTSSSSLSTGNREVLPQTGEVHKPQIDGLDILLPAQRQYFFRGHNPVLSNKNHVSVVSQSARWVAGASWHDRPASGTGTPAVCKPSAIPAHCPRHRRPQSLLSSGLEMTLPFLDGWAGGHCRVRFISDACLDCKHRVLVSQQIRPRRGEKEGGGRKGEGRTAADTNPVLLPSPLPPPPSAFPTFPLPSEPPWFGRAGCSGRGGQNPRRRF